MSDQTPNPTEDTEESKPERIAKRIARSGVCSRRDAERMIEEGLVKLNGKVLDSPAVTVTDEDEIYVNGKPLPHPQQLRTFHRHLQTIQIQLRQTVHHQLVLTGGQGLGESTAEMSLGGKQHRLAPRRRDSTGP